MLTATFANINANLKSVLPPYHTTPSNEGDNQEEDNKKVKEEDNSPGFDEEEVDYSEEQYPSADDKYK